MFPWKKSQNDMHSLNTTFRRMRINPILAAGVLFSLASLLANPPGDSVSKFDFLCGYWETFGGLLHPECQATWSVALAKGDLPPDQFVEAGFVVEESGIILGVKGETNGWVPPGRPQFGGWHMTYGADLPGENDPQSDLGFFLRYDPSGKIPSFYRVQVAALPQCGEITLWKTGGGYVAAKPFPFEIGKEYRLRAEARGETITVTVDGKSALTYRDTAPLSKGRPGLGGLRSRVGFRDVQAGALKEDSPATSSPVKRQPDFHLRDWNPAHPGKWLFDGAEPVFCFTGQPDSSLVAMKIRPGYAPVISYCPIFLTQWNAPELCLEQFDKIEFGKGGMTWDITVNLKPNAGDGATAVWRMRVSYDPSLDTYVYDFDLDLAVHPEKPWKYTHPLEWFDLYPISVTGSVLDWERVPRQRYQWILWEQPDDQPPRKLGLQHDYQFAGAQPDGSNTFKGPGSALDLRTGGIAAFGIEPDVNIVTRILDDGQLPHLVDLCAWGTDWHFRCRGDSSKWTSGQIPAGTRIRLKWRMNHEKPEVLRPILGRAKHLRDSVLPQKLPAFEWPKTTFARTVDMHEPHNPCPWVGGTLLTNQGYGDSACIRLEPGQKTGPASFGLSPYYPFLVFRYGKRTVTFDAIAEKESGQIKVTCSNSLPRNETSTSEANIGTAWKSYTVDIPAMAGAISSSFTMANTGRTPVLIDNVAFNEIPEAKKPACVVEAESIAPTLLAVDPDASNGMALLLPPEHSTPTFPLDLSAPGDVRLPPGEYRVKMRVKVEDNTAAQAVVSWSVLQTDNAKERIPAQGAWKGTDFAKPNVYEEKEFVFQREAAGRLNFSFARLTPNGKIWIDSLTLTRMKDGWKRPLPSDRNRW
jgi:hypothetical protein